MNVNLNYTMVLKSLKPERLRRQKMVESKNISVVLEIINIASTFVDLLEIIKNLKSKLEYSDNLYSVIGKYIGYYLGKTEDQLQLNTDHLLWKVNTAILPFICLRDGSLPRLLDMANAVLSMEYFL